MTAPSPARPGGARLVSPGDAVRQGAALLVVVEAMKMGLTPRSPADAVVDRVLAAENEMVAEKMEPVRFRTAP